MKNQQLVDPTNTYDKLIQVLRLRFSYPKNIQNFLFSLIQSTYKCVFFYIILYVDVWPLINDHFIRINMEHYDIMHT